MIEKLKTAAEALWEDEKTFLEALSILGVREFIATLRSPVGTEVVPAAAQYVPDRNETYPAIAA